MKDGGSAFPVMWNQNTPGELIAEPGMTLRDWFAGQAISGALLAPRPSEGMVVSPEGLAQACYKYADAMIKERYKEVV